MRHPSEGALRSYHDDELTPAARLALKGHLETCERCRARLARITAETEQVSRELAELGPGPLDRPQPRRALARLQTSVEGSEGITMLEKLKTDRRWQRAAAGIAALIVLVGLFSLAPVRALASDLLSVFRVERFVVVNVSPERIEEIDAVLGEDFYFGEQEVLQEPGDPVEAASLDEAAGILGWTPRAPEGYDAPDHIGVAGATRMRFTPDVESLRLVFEAMELDPELLPASIDGQPFTFSVPASAIQSWGEERDGTLALMQVPSPTVDVPDGVDMRALGEAMLQLLGMTPEEAARLSETIDWTNTLVLPLPSDLGQIQEISVDGTTGLLLVSEWQGEIGETSRNISLMWQKGGYVYVITAQGAQETSSLLRLAEALP